MIKKISLGLIVFILVVNCIAYTVKATDITNIASNNNSYSNSTIPYTSGEQSELLNEISKSEYDNLYTYIEVEQNYSVGITSQKYVYGANVFQRSNTSREGLVGVGFNIIGEGTDVTLYYYDSSISQDTDVNNLKEITKFTNLAEGYHVIKLGTPIYIGKTFSIIIKYENAGEKVSIPMEANYTSLGKEDKLGTYTSVVSNPGESSYSFNGKDWIELYNRQLSSGTVLKDTNICIDAYTKSDVTSDSEYIANPDIKVINENHEYLLYGIDEGKTADEFKNENYFTTGYTIKVYDDSENEITNTKIGTNSIIRIFDDSNNLIKQYIVVIYGDTNGDGNINSADALAIIRNKLEISKFNAVSFLEAGRTTLSTRMNKKIPSAVDALAVVKHKLNVEKISQK